MARACQSEKYYFFFTCLLALFSFIDGSSYGIGALGLAGFLRNKKNGIIKGYLLGISGRFFFSFLSGVVFFGMYAPESFSMFGADIPLNAYTYSALYNGGYIFTEGALTVAVLMVPAMRRSMEYVKGMATNTVNRKVDNL